MKDARQGERRCRTCRNPAVVGDQCAECDYNSRRPEAPLPVGWACKHPRKERISDRPLKAPQEPEGYAFVDGKWVGPHERHAILAQRISTLERELEHARGWLRKAALKFDASGDWLWAEMCRRTAAGEDDSPIEGRATGMRVRGLEEAARSLVDTLVPMLDNLVPAPDGRFKGLPTCGQGYVDLVVEQLDALLMALNGDGISAPQPAGTGDGVVREARSYRVAFNRLLTLMARAYGEEGFPSAPPFVGRAMNYAAEIAMGLREWTPEPNHDLNPEEAEIVAALTEGSNG